jgi:hypothetical protein
LRRRSRRRRKRRRRRRRRRRRGSQVQTFLPGFSLAEGFKEATVYQPLKVQCETNLLMKLK